MIFSGNWQLKTRNPWLRQLQIASVIVSFLSQLCWDFFTRNRSLSTRKQRARWLTSQFLALGPTFIKIGQSLSTRADLIPAEYVQEFSKLQDQVPAIDSNLVLDTIESEFGRPIEEIFADFEIEPLACASLGQVHLAELFNGEKVVVKVQRPSLRELFELDFQVLNQGVQFLNIYIKSLRKYNLEKIYQEFFNLLFLEIDYLNEGKNAERFRLNFKDEEKIKVPKIYWQLTTNRVLTLEYLPGVKINDRAALELQGINLNDVIQLGVCSYLKQLLLDGFFQSDPHPGNMAVTVNGELIFYDFGTMSQVKSMNQGQMIETFFAILNKDTEKVTESLIYMGLIEPSTDLYALKSVISFLLERFLEKPLDLQMFGDLSAEITLIFKQQPFRLPAQMTFILKSLMTLDGVARSLNPEYNLILASQPFVKTITMGNTPDKRLITVAQGFGQIVKQVFTNSGGNSKVVSLLEQTSYELKLRSSENEKLLKKVDLLSKTLVNLFLAGFSTIIGILLSSSPHKHWTLLAFGLAGLSAMFFVRFFWKMMLTERS